MESITFKGEKKTILKTVPDLLCSKSSHINQGLSPHYSERESYTLVSLIPSGIKVLSLFFFKQ